jgi:hypothetical protein
VETTEEFDGQVVNDEGIETATMSLMNYIMSLAQRHDT